MARRMSRTPHPAAPSAAACRRPPVRKSCKALRATPSIPAVEGLLHIKLKRSPHAHARIVAIDKTPALDVPGVQAVLTFEDAPARLFSTARHEKAWMDPDDTRILDNVVRFIGQKVAAVVADSEAAAEEGCRRLQRRLRDPACGDRSRAGRSRRARPRSIRTRRRNIGSQTPRATSSRKAMANMAMSPMHWRNRPSPMKARSRRSGSSMPRWRPMAASPGSTRTAC